MKLVVFADVHLDAAFAWAGAMPDVARALRRSLRDTLAWIVRRAVDERADALLCAGDLFEHERVTPDTLASVATLFGAAAPLPIYVAPGNHDWLAPNSPYQTIRWPANVHVFGEERLQPVTLADGLTLWGAAHRRPAGTAGFLDTFRVDRAGIHLALFHGAERGALAFQEEGKQPHAPFEAEQIGPAGLHHCFVGHYHVARDAPRHTYPGNPHPLAFGQEGERGAVLATVGPDGSVTRQRWLAPTITFHDVALDATGAASMDELRRRATNALAGRSGVARLTVHGELADGLDLRLSDLTEASGALLAVTARIGQLVPALDLRGLEAEQTVRGQFVRDVRAAPDLDEEMRRRVLLTGLRALAGRTDLWVA